MNPKGNFPVIHGMTDTPTHNTWKGMRQRCLNPSCPDFPLYGGRGITICDRWSDFRHFLKDIGEMPKGHSIERIDNNGEYSPENCCWIPMAQQAKNRRSVRWLVIDGIRKNLTQWCAYFGISQACASQRLARGWTLRDAVSRPKMRNIT